jgi:hypothetical protein
LHLFDHWSAAAEVPTGPAELRLARDLDED